MEYAFAILFSAWLVALATWDLRSRRLPNALTLGGAAVAVALSAAAGGAGGALASLEGGAACAALLLVPFFLKAAGAGDVKFLFAVGCFFGIARAVETLFFVSVCGLALALVFPVFVPKEKRREIPFGIAIAAGAWIELAFPLLF
ncbi:MAG: prepilin peptidase [Kiritimatiellae bacterium]|nr:prepilin peptidase [Kiritimatiellia bacterium]